MEQKKSPAAQIAAAVRARHLRLASLPPAASARQNWGARTTRKKQRRLKKSLLHPRQLKHQLL
jgi:hypothetical protein